MIIKARAPCRLGLAGGGTDIPAYFNVNRGAVLNVAINLYSYTSLSRIKDRATEIISHDWDINRKITDLKFEFFKNTTTNVDIVRAAMKECKVNPKNGYELILNSSAPKNSGLAGSSALLVSMLGAFHHLSNGSFVDRQELAEMAYKVERIRLRRAGGVQDQYAAVFGGFNFLEFSKEENTVSPLRLEPDLLCELHSSFLLFEAPTQRVFSASHVESKKIDNIIDNMEYLDPIKKHAYEMRTALMHGDIEEMGGILNESWEEKRKMDLVSSNDINRLIEKGKSAGAYGGKICGAGGGGFLFFICSLENRKQVIKTMKSESCSLQNFDFSQKGLQTWRVN